MWKVANKSRYFERTGFMQKVKKVYQLILETDNVANDDLLPNLISGCSVFEKNHWWKCLKKCGDWTVEKTQLYSFCLLYYVWELLEYWSIHFSLLNIWKVSKRRGSNKKQSCGSELCGSDVVHEKVAARVKKHVKNKGRCKVLQKQKRPSESTAPGIDLDSDFEGDAPAEIMSPSFQRKTFNRNIQTSESKSETESTARKSEKIKKTGRLS